MSSDYYAGQCRKHCSESVKRTHSYTCQPLLGPVQGRCQQRAEGQPSADRGGPEDKTTSGGTGRCDCRASSQLTGSWGGVRRLLGQEGTPEGGWAHAVRVPKHDDSPAVQGTGYIQGDWTQNPLEDNENPTSCNWGSQAWRWERGKLERTLWCHTRNTVARDKQPDTDMWVEMRTWICTHGWAQVIF